MPKEKFCSPDKYSILIPYKDFVKLLGIADDLEEMKRLYKRMDERCAAMQNMYSELLEKIAEIDRYL